MGPKSGSKWGPKCAQKRGHSGQKWPKIGPCKKCDTEAQNANSCQKVTCSLARKLRGQMAFRPQKIHRKWPKIAYKCGVVTPHDIEVSVDYQCSSPPYRGRWSAFFRLNVRPSCTRTPKISQNGLSAQNRVRPACSGSNKATQGGAANPLVIGYEPNASYGIRNQLSHDVVNPAHVEDCLANSQPRPSLCPRSGAPSRHRGAEPVRRCELRGPTSLLSLGSLTTCASIPRKCPEKWCSAEPLLEKG